MAKVKCWYKNIKVGDVLEVKFGPGHIRALDGTVIAEVTSCFGGGFFTGISDEKTKEVRFLADFSDPWLTWNDVSFIRKIKSSKDKES